jgi:hypothetical protein
LCQSFASGAYRSAPGNVEEQEEEEEKDACVRDIVGSVKDFGDAPSVGPLCDWGATSLEGREKCV